MRVNIYSQELLDMVVPVHKLADTGIHYYGVRFPLISPDVLHHTPTDDDRSGVTFWIPADPHFNRAALAQMFMDAATMVNALPESGEGMTPLFDRYVLGPDNVHYGPFTPHEDKPTD